MRISGEVVSSDHKMMVADKGESMTVEQAQVYSIYYSSTLILPSK